MTKMLASVTCVAEAMIALELGADIIDLKNPRNGALGALPTNTLREIVAAIDGQRPISATIGDLPNDSGALKNNILATAASGVDIVKIGVASRAEMDNIIEARNAIDQSIATRFVAVLFADKSWELDWISRFADADFFGVMLDTAGKSAGNLRQHIDAHRLAEFVRRARNRRLLCGLAGSLRVDDISALLALNPDYLGFRGALCANHSRVAQLEPHAFASVRDRIPFEFSTLATSDHAPVEL